MRRGIRMEYLTYYPDLLWPKITTSQDFSYSVIYPSYQTIERALKDILIVARSSGSLETIKLIAQDALDKNS
jgi:hypothetical protein